MKKFGLASFWRPAKQNVKPRNARSGRRAHPLSESALDGGVISERRGRATGSTIPNVFGQVAADRAVHAPGLGSDGPMNDLVDL